MNNWKKVTLNDIGKIVTGKTPKTKNTEFWNGGIPFVTPADLQKSKHIFSTERTVSHIGLNSVKGATLPAGAVCVSCIGNLGYTALTTQKSVSNQQINSIIPNSDFDNDFVYYLMKSLWDEFKNLEGQSTTLSILNKTLFSKIEVLVPEKVTQQRIAQLLSSLDDKIELNAQINHNLEEQLYALYASNYDNLSGKKVPLKECCSFQEGYVNPTQTKPEYFDGSVKWLRAVDINESFIISTSRTLTEQGFASAGKSALLFPKDSIAISKSGTIGRLGIVADNMCGNRAVINIVPKQKKWLAFIYCYLKSRQAEFSDLAVGSVQKNLYVSILEPLEIFSPADSVLNDFHFSAQTILEKMKNNCFEMQSLAQLRDALLPKLMSGEIDVSEVEV